MRMAKISIKKYVGTIILHITHENSLHVCLLSFMMILFVQILQTWAENSTRITFVK